MSLVVLLVSATAWLGSPAGAADGSGIQRFPGADMPGNDGGWVRGVLSLEACERICLTDEACAGYTYNIAYTTCIPKSSIGALVPAREPTISGILHRPAAAPRNPPASRGYAVRRLPGMDAPGNDAGWIRDVADIDACEQLCVADPRCAGYTYNGTRAACFTKTAIASVVPVRDAAVTGIVTREGGSPPPASRTGPVAQAGAAPAPPVAAPKPSFECRRDGGPTERAICASGAISKADADLATEYRRSLEGQAGKALRDEQQRQRTWLVARNRCGPETACLQAAYDRRLSELRTSVAIESERRRLAARFADTLQPPPATQLINRADQPCQTARSELDRLRRSLAVRLPDGPKAAADELRAIAWQTEGRPPAGPAYLMLASEGPVRFRGEGFYVLTPGAAAPFRLRQFENQTRAVIPLHVDQAPHSGRLEVRALAAGSLKVSAAIVAFTACGENADPHPVGLDLQVEPGAAEIVIADRFGLALPDQVIGSPDGTRRLEVFGQRYRLVDRAKGAILVDSIGTEPRFSPTGRFVAVRAADRYELRDAIDGRLIQKVTESIRSTKSADLLWDDRDSFLIAPTYGRYGIVPILSTLNETSGIEPAGGGCGHSAAALDGMAFSINLENDVAAADCDEGGEIAYTSLSVMPPKDGKPAAQAKAVAERFVTRMPPLKGWKTIDGLKITHGSGWGPGHDAADPLQRMLARFLVKPVVLERATASVSASAAETWQVARRGLRSIKLPAEAQASHQDERLRSFGIEVNHGSALRTGDPARLLRKVAENRYDLVPDAAIRILSGRDETMDAYGEARRNGQKTEIHVPDLANTLSQAAIRKRLLTLVNSTWTDGSEQFIYPQAYLHDTARPGELFDLSAQFPDTDGSGWTCTDNSFFGCDVAGEIFFERYLVLWSKDSAALSVYDIDRRELVRQIVNLPSPDVMARVSLAKDLKTLLKLDTDGGFQILPLSPAERDAKGKVTAASTRPTVLIHGRMVDDEVAVWTPTGRFDATPEGSSYVNLRFPGRDGEYTLAQYHRDFHVDHLLDRVLSGKTFAPPAVRSAPPRIEVQPTVTGDTVAAHVTLVGEDAVDEIRLYQDGLVTDTIRVPPGEKSLDIRIRRLAGARWIALLARGASGLYSQPITLDAGRSPGDKRRLHVVGIGIDHYADSRFPTLNARIDAERFTQALQARAGGEVEIASQVLLLDDAASRDAILSRLTAVVAAASPGESIVLFVAGHGVQLPNEAAYYLATSATNVDDLAHTALPWADLAAILAKARTRVSVFLDTCQSGHAGTDFFASNDAAAGALIDRAPSGVLIFSASKGWEKSEEAPDDSGGVFTGAVLRALSSDRTDLNRNGAIEASELYAAVKRTVVETTAGRQTPWFARNDMIGDFVPF